MCPTNEQLSAYYDRRIEGVSDAQMEQHVASCPRCAAELGSLAELSGLFAALEDGSPSAFRLPPSALRLSPLAQRRLHQRADQFMQRPVRRLAWIVDAVAACLIVGCSLGLLAGQSKAKAVPASAAAPPPWVKVDAASDSESLTQQSPVAQWYLADASNSREDQ